MVRWPLGVRTGGMDVDSTWESGFQWALWRGHRGAGGGGGLGTKNHGLEHLEPEICFF